MTYELMKSSSSFLIAQAYLPILPFGALAAATLVNFRIQLIGF
jgi:hypothetical protein